MRINNYGIVNNIYKTRQFLSKSKYYTVFLLAFLLYNSAYTQSDIYVNFKSVKTDDYINMYSHTYLKHNDTIFACRFTKISNSSITFHHIPSGLYTIESLNIFGEPIYATVDVKDSLDLMTEMYPDSIDQSRIKESTLVDLMKEGDSMMITLTTTECYTGMTYDSLLIILVNNKFLAFYAGMAQVLDTTDIQLIRIFETELEKIKKSTCQTLSSIREITVHFGEVHRTFIDKTCYWGGFMGLVRDLF